MKKILTLITLISSSSIFAMTTVSLDDKNYTCNGTRINSQATISLITMNCPNAKVIMHEEPTGGMYADRQPGGGAAMTMAAPSADDETLMDKVEFHSDKGTYLICYYKNNKLVKCKAKPIKNAVPASSTVANKTSPIKPTASVAK